MDRDTTLNLILAFFGVLAVGSYFYAEMVLLRKTFWEAIGFKKREDR
jgi:hypothetical protein